MEGIMKTHRLRLFCLLTLSLLIASHLVFAQAGRGKARVNGIITDEEGKPLAGVKVTLELLQSESIQRETATDKNGEWVFIGLGSGNWRLTATAEGYIPISTTFFVSQLEKNPKIPLKLKKPEVTKGSTIRDDAALAYIERANQLFNDKDYDGALVILEQFLAQNQTVYQAYILVGDCHKEKGDFDKAIEAYNKAIEEAKTDELMGKEMTAKGLAGIGDCYLRRGDFEKAQGFFKESIDTYPENETLAYNVGEIYFSNQKLDEAVQYFTVATQIKPDWAPPYHKLGLVYLNKADYEKAKENFKKFLELEPDTELAGQVKNILAYLETIKK
jgi:tetratricopeptide (TPR) repeat protein